jgi:hypothetical protein
MSAKDTESMQAVLYTEVVFLSARYTGGLLTLRTSLDLMHRRIVWAP